MNQRSANLGHQIQHNIKIKTLIMRRINHYGGQVSRLWVKNTYPLISFRTLFWYIILWAYLLLWLNYWLCSDLSKILFLYFCLREIDWNEETVAIIGSVLTWAHWHSHAPTICLFSRPLVKFAHSRFFNGINAPHPLKHQQLYARRSYRCWISCRHECHGRDFRTRISVFNVPHQIQDAAGIKAVPNRIDCSSGLDNSALSIVSLFEWF